MTLSRGVLLVDGLDWKGVVTLWRDLGLGF